MSAVAPISPAFSPEVVPESPLFIALNIWRTVGNNWSIILSAKRAWNRSCSAVVSSSFCCLSTPSRSLTCFSFLDLSSRFFFSLAAFSDWAGCFIASEISLAIAARRPFRLMKLPLKRFQTTSLKVKRANCEGSFSFIFLAMSSLA